MFLPVALHDWILFECLRIVSSHFLEARQVSKSLTWWKKNVPDTRTWFIMIRCTWRAWLFPRPKKIFAPSLHSENSETMWDTTYLSKEHGHSSYVMGIHRDQNTAKTAFLDGWRKWRDSTILACSLWVTIVWIRVNTWSCELQSCDFRPVKTHLGASTFKVVASADYPELQPHSVRWNVDGSQEIWSFLRMIHS